MLIVIEGIDGTGKGTQMDLLKKRFANAVFVKYPTEKFDILTRYLEKKVEISKKALFLTFLADIEDDQKRIRRLLDEGKLVIMDRYALSTIAYELGEVGHERAKKIVSELELIRPDKIILLDIEIDEAMKRKANQKTPDRYEEDKKHLARVREKFLSLMKERFLSTIWHKIDANKTIEEVHSEIVSLIK
jgi:dTMP kinase